MFTSRLEFWKMKGPISVASMSLQTCLLENLPFPAGLVPTEKPAFSKINDAVLVAAESQYPCYVLLLQCGLPCQVLYSTGAMQSLPKESYFVTGVFMTRCFMLVKFITSRTGSAERSLIDFKNY